MRLTLSLLAAIGVHGALFGVAAALLSRPPANAEAPAAIDVAVAVEVIPPRPDPMADSVTGAVTPAAKLVPAPERPRVARHVRALALVDDTSAAAPTPAAPPLAAEAPSVSMTAAAIALSRAPARAVPGAQGAGAVVSAQPRYRTNPRPDYPLPSLRRREEGIVLLDVQVQADGTPAAISLNRSCGHPLLDRAALDAVRRWTFEPARAAGVPVSSRVVVPVRFSLDDR